ncbi:MAG: hypothetical protein FJ405_07000 [Verrucomicrobia bacterium]|nr:hypothetical protein [Verrucomicrobiota bacterium]
MNVREILLNGHKPVDPPSQIRLVSVQADETTVIRTRSGKMLMGKPGARFTVNASKGRKIQLLMASPQQGEALFEERTIPVRPVANRLEPR